MAQRCVSDANEVDIEVTVGLVIGATTVAELDGLLEKSYAESVTNPQRNVTLTGSLKITGKSNLGRSMYRYRLSDFWVSSCRMIHRKPQIVMIKDVLTA